MGIFERIAKLYNIKWRATQEELDIFEEKCKENLLPLFINEYEFEDLSYDESDWRLETRLETDEFMLLRYEFKLEKSGNFSFEICYSKKNLNRKSEYKRIIEKKDAHFVSDIQKLLAGNNLFDLYKCRNGLPGYLFWYEFEATFTNQKKSRLYVEDITLYPDFEHRFLTRLKEKINVDKYLKQLWEEVNTK